MVIMVIMVIIVRRVTSVDWIGSDLRRAAHHGHTRVLEEAPAQCLVSVCTRIHWCGEKLTDHSSQTRGRHARLPPELGTESLPPLGWTAFGLRLMGDTI
jgi:hypothetical protein